MHESTPNLPAKLKGSCLCGEVSFEVSPPFRVFQYCHCQRCRKFTGTAHASNLFVDPKQFKWLTGENRIQRFELSEAKYFATCFCNQCGSSLPWLVQGGINLVVPAGSLDDDPGLRPKQSIYCGSKAEWYENPADLPSYDELPPRKPKP